MYLVPFFVVEPDLAAEETRSVTLFAPHDGVPAGSYGCFFSTTLIMTRRQSQPVPCVGPFTGRPGRRREVDLVPHRRFACGPAVTSGIPEVNHGQVVDGEAGKCLPPKCDFQGSRPRNHLRRSGVHECKPPCEGRVIGRRGACNPRGRPRYELDDSRRRHGSGTDRRRDGLQLTSHVLSGYGRSTRRSHQPCGIVPGYLLCQPISELVLSG